MHSITIDKIKLPAVRGSNNGEIKKTSVQIHYVKTVTQHSGYKKAFIGKLAGILAFGIKPARIPYVVEMRDK
jgi:hypothetical protein